MRKKNLSLHLYSNKELICIDCDVTPAFMSTHTLGTTFIECSLYVVVFIGADTDFSNFE